jgi:hypothetical protein
MLHTSGHWGLTMSFSVTAFITVALIRLSEEEGKSGLINSLCSSSKGSDPEDIMTR